MSKKLSIEEVNKRLQKVHQGKVNLDPFSYVKIHTKAKFIDKNFGEWYAFPSDVLGGHGHPKRAAQTISILKTIPLDKVQKQILENHKGNISIDPSTYVGVYTKAKFIDKEYGEWWTFPCYILEGHGHPKRGYANVSLALSKYFDSSGVLLSTLSKQAGAPCSVIQRIAQKYGQQVALDYLNKNLDSNGKYKLKISSLETIFKEQLKDIFPNLELWNKQPLETNSIAFHPDFRLEGIGKILYVDVHGLWIHCNMNKDNKYHFNRAHNFLFNNICLLQFFEDEIRDKFAIVKSIIISKLGIIDHKYAARKLNFKEVPFSEAKEFLEMNHLMGSMACKTIGLYNNNELICLLGYKIKKDIVTIERFCTKLNTSCVGGFGKLVSYLKQFNKPIISYCDLRYADGHSYEKLGFQNIGETLGWSWTDGVYRYNRLMCRAGSGKTERENATIKKWFKIYDAGQRKYRLDL